MGGVKANPFVWESATGKSGSSSNGSSRKNRIVLVVSLDRAARIIDERRVLSRFNSRDRKSRSDHCNELPGGTLETNSPVLIGTVALGRLAFMERPRNEGPGLTDPEDLRKI